ncbi:MULTISPECIES: lysozyme inhibitor Ivy [Pseudomonas]|uniref:Inhibitor of vertebrate lysozyme n=1 Tax=Pseudomonas aeruginosa TaxID=287 RepID=A0A2R4KQC0_PSEAI|nr:MULTISPECIES: lysozyme inhibitor Ivy [Pseudomonas]AVV63313.1 Inhibitor of vertebrate lysozyme [Pseudomonas aeruginosa]MBI7312027.1 inhibitor of vertebrate lysozyme family protein [Pseudomonas aeruginosa]MDV7793117.1 lysozyme inhibitor Ivy [Pseudomonas aeruginosa]RCM99625.1 Inhibitor of vertebrate lysozyme precursor [Pseudomonas aeruginosa]RQI57146.1 lysozyme inhibitor [Pseudomonas aeruginosa]
MNGVSRLLSLALLGAALHWAPAQAEEQPRLFELLGQPGYKATWHAMFKGESDVPKWVSDASGPSSPSTSLSLEGQPYVLANSCKPHDCGNNRLLVAFRGDKSAAYGLQVSLPDEPAEVMQMPSKYATYRWYGEPSRQVRELLMKQLESDPNWK